MSEYGCYWLLEEFPAICWAQLRRSFPYASCKITARKGVNVELMIIEIYLSSSFDRNGKGFCMGCLIGAPLYSGMTGTWLNWGYAFPSNCCGIYQIVKGFNFPRKKHLTIDSIWFCIFISCDRNLREYCKSWIVCRVTWSIEANCAARGLAEDD